MGLFRRSKVKQSTPPVVPARSEDRHDDKTLITRITVTEPRDFVSPKEAVEQETEQNDESYQKKIHEQRHHIRMLKQLSIQHLKARSRAAASITTEHTMERTSLDGISDDQIMHHQDRSGNSGSVNKVDEMQVIEPWLEGGTPLTLKEFQKTDSDTEPTLCSAMEMLSFETLCGVASDTADRLVPGGLGPPDPDFRVINSIVAAYDIPREISFRKDDDPGRRPRTFRQQVSFENPAPTESVLLRIFRGKLPRQGKRSSSAKVSKVKIFMEKPPPPLAHTHSIENSTVTMPPEICQSMTDVNCLNAEFGPLCTTQY